MKNFICLLLFVICLFSCSKKDQTKSFIVGDWQACRALQGNTNLDIDYSKINLSFNKSKYQFNSIFDYKEYGDYDIVGKVLVLTDTFSNIASDKDKNLIIEEISKDSLKLLMSFQNKKTLVVFYKTQIDNTAEKNVVLSTTKSADSKTKATQAKPEKAKAKKAVTKAKTKQKKKSTKASKAKSKKSTAKKSNKKSSKKSKGSSNKKKRKK